MPELFEKEPEPIRPHGPTERCVYILALVIVAVINFIDAVPYHVRYYLWCAWYYTGGQIRLLIMDWRLHLEQRSIRRGNPWYRKEH